MCTTCPGFNSSGEQNAGKPTYQYAAPLSSFVGRYVDSNDTVSVQHIGMRTARAGFMRVALNQRGTAPPRLYSQIGQAVGIYSLSTFFTTKLQQGLSPVNVIGTGSGYGGRSPLEKIAIFDAHVYPESTNSGGWQVPVADNQDRLWDLDVDDRGYVYMAYDEFGWGIVKDNGETNSTHLQKTVQVIDGLGNLRPTGIFTLKSNSRYFAFVSDVGTATMTYVYDVTTPGSPSAPSVRSGSLHGFQAWAKDDENQVLAVYNGDGKVMLYTYAAYVSGGSAFDQVSPSSGRYLKGLSFDDQGNLWVTERGAKSPESNVIHRLMRNGSGSYNHSTVSAYPGAFFPKFMNAAAGYLAVGGTIMYNGKEANQLYIFKIESSGALRLLDVDDFFRKYYHAPPSGYAQPGGFVATPAAVQIVKQGTKTYLLYGAWGLGDVYQLGADGPVLTATMKSAPFGTTNPNAQPTQAGPFPGDVVTFSASVTPSATHTLNWNFGNTEAGSANTRSGSTGVDITHQFTGLNTTTKITSKSVTATSTADSEMNSGVSVPLKVPEARIAINATNEVITGSSFEVVYGDEFVDASDGTIESHVATWKIGATQTALRPDEAISVGGLGQRSVEFTGSYGKYDPNTLALPANAFPAVIAARGYEVKPFIAKLKQATRVGNTVTYGADARYTSDNAVLSATQWTVHWTLKTGIIETASRTDVVPVGNVPNFSFEKTLLLTGSVVKLEISVPEANVSDPAYATYSVTSNVTVPDPLIQLTNCGFVNDNCSIKTVSSSLPSASTASWQLQWVVKRGATTVASGSGNPLATFKLTGSGAHTVTVTETVFDISATLPFEVGASLCGAPPTSIQLAINASCTSGCTVGLPINFDASLFQYVVQACDVFSWTFGDGETATGQSVSHTYASSNSRTVTLKVSNSNSPSGTSVTKAITFGVTTPPCTSPSSINFSYANTQGCSASGGCRTGESIRFTPTRGSGSLLSCDEAEWSFGDGSSGSTTKQPSKTYSAPGTYTVTLVVKNTNGTSSPVTKQITILPGSGGSCQAAPTEAQVTLAYTGRESQCRKNSSIPCKEGEVIDFAANFFQYTPQACDRFEWNFGDGTANSTAQSPTHTFPAGRTSSVVSLKVYTTSNSTGVTLQTTVSIGQITPAKPIPVLTMGSFPTVGSKGAPVTFSVNSNISATGWLWNFGDGPNDSSQSTVIGTSSTIQHTYLTSGTYNVTVKARNSEDVANAQTGNALGTGLVISDVPEYKFLLPVVTHGPGQNGSTWRTDVQIYTSDPSVSPQNPLRMQAILRDIPRTLEVYNSTFTYEDFMRVFTNATSDSGPVIITVRSHHLPQIWTRTYNLTETGTFGQFIPAIRIDAAAGAGSAFGEGKYYIAGLRQDANFRTNLGFLNPNAQTINATVKVFDDNQAQVGQFTLQLPQYKLDQFAITDPKAVPNLSPNRPFSVEVTVPEGQWLIGYASLIQKSGDPTFVQAVRESELGLTDYGQIVIPGVGHVGEWRSDITIFNPDSATATVDLAYHDQSGTKVAEAKNVQIRPREFLQYTDVIKQGILGNVPDSLGVLRVTTSGPFPPTRYPLTFARTYNDKGTGFTFGQGIG
ncbi:MAG TPA: PKD domain-containing protein, partial [Thermoanaerobaculia bacterium]|nr:PKD domain-containing protein [Thermoanaerobaculia bacterium]